MCVCVVNVSQIITNRSQRGQQQATTEGYVESVLQYIPLPKQFTESLWINLGVYGYST